MPNVALHGVWRTRAYGMIIRISPLFIDVYEETQVSCLHWMRLPANTWALGTQDVRLSVNENTLRLEAGNSPVEADKLKQLPETCAKPLDNPENPVMNYEIFWQTFNTHYAFFDLYDVDWDARYTRYRPLVHENTSKHELLQIMKDSLTGLNDGHTMIITEEETFSAAQPHRWEAQRANIVAVHENYIQGDIKKIKGTTISYGWLNPDLAYISIRGMVAKPPFLQTEARLVDRVMKQIVLDTQSAKAIVVDVRFNQGGSGEVAEAIAKRFTKQRSFAYSYTSRDGDSYTDAINVYLEPDGDPVFTQPIYLLVSDLSASAAETFALALGELPQVTVVGQSTAGIFSDMLERQLPNGWAFTLSHQRYIAADGKLYESLGVPVDIAYSFDLEGLLAGKDNLLEEIIRLASRP